MAVWAYTMPEVRLQIKRFFSGTGKPVCLVSLWTRPELPIGRQMVISLDFGPPTSVSKESFRVKKLRSKRPVRAGANFIRHVRLSNGKLRDSAQTRGSGRAPKLLNNTHTSLYPSHLCPR
jgi:hypothetical protein